MKRVALNNTETLAQPSGDRVGAVIVGGDFHGLGIIRSLGRHGVPLCVIDDEYSIGRFSKYTTFTVRAPNLRNEKETVDFLVEMGHRKKLTGLGPIPYSRRTRRCVLSAQAGAVAGFPRSHAGLGNHEVGLE